MNRIRLLSEHVANQIAAGEVIERPASVVKELVENALDAQAARIAVEIQAGGRSLIRVTDDGVGMSRDDALLCLERHATSKLQRAEDLQAITTMGFRGEALPSIASVSRFTLTTLERDATAPDGTQVVIHGGKIIEVKAAGCAPGTAMEVRQLFYNLPPRRKFLRSEETERAHIQHYLMLVALAYPAVALTFTSDTRQVWQLPAVAHGDDTTSRLAAVRERLRVLRGGQDKFLAVDFTGELEAAASEEDAVLHERTTTPLRLWGFIGAPGVSRSTREEQHVFVNRRPVENRGLNFALTEGYHTALMKGRYPVCCLFLEIDPGEVDVNIHPSKREVKFRHEGNVRRLVTEAVRETLLRYHTPAASVRPVAPVAAPAASAEDSAAAQLPLQSAAGAPPVPAPANAPSPTEETSDLPNFGISRTAKPVIPWPQRTPLPDSPTAPTPSTRVVPTPTSSPAPSAPKSAPASSAIAPPRPSGPPLDAPVPLLAVPLRLVGVIGKLYVVLESDRGLVLLDQHAAHERILFEQMLSRLEQGGAPSQRLLLPETVELPPRDAQFLREQIESLTRLGVGVSEFGERTFLVDALPPFVRVSDPRRFVLELVDELKAVGQTINVLRLGEHVVAKTVCRHAVKANDPLAGPELENLVNDLRRCTMPYTCPHGRPTMIEMNFRELEKKFGRSQ